MIAVRVNGLPAPQGSKRVLNGNLVESSRAVGPWRDAVRSEIQRVVFTRAAGEPDLRIRQPAAVSVVIDFYLPKPKSAPRRQEHPVRRPDVDKLTRATLDGITEGGAIADDSQVVTLYVRKMYAYDEQPPGACIWIREQESWQ